MNCLIICLVGLLALANGAFIYPFGYNPAFATPYAAIRPTTYAAYQPTPYAAYYPTTYAAYSPTTYAGFHSAPLVRAIDVKEVKSDEAVVTPYAGFTPITGATSLNRYHGQGDDGSYSYGYFDGPHSKQEVRDRFGNIRGGYSYIDPSGKLQNRQYIADASGFRVAATNLPIAPELPKFHDLKTIKETDEVKAARTKFEKTFDEAKDKTRSKREADPAFFTATYNVHNPAIGSPAIVSQAIHSPVFRSSVLEKSTYQPFIPTQFPAHYPFNMYSHFPSVYSAAHFPLTYSGFPSFNLQPTILQPNQIKPVKVTPEVVEA